MTTGSGRANITYIRSLNFLSASPRNSQLNFSSSLGLATAAEKVMTNTSSKHSARMMSTGGNSNRLSQLEFTDVDADATIDNLLHLKSMVTKARADREMQKQAAHCAHLRAQNLLLKEDNERLKDVVADLEEKLRMLQTILDSKVRRVYY